MRGGDRMGDRYPYRKRRVVVEGRWLDDVIEL